MNSGQPEKMRFWKKMIAKIRASLGAIIFFIAGVLLILNSSCVSTGLGTAVSSDEPLIQVSTIEPPAWVGEVSSREKDEFFMTGGPAPTLDEARNMALAEISYMVKTDVYAVTEDYTNVSKHAVDTIMEQQLSIMTRATTDSVLSGVRIADTYQDGESGQWWVRAVISEANLEQSKQDTLAQLEQLQELFGQYREYFADTVLNLMSGVQPYVHHMRLAVSALKSLYGLPSYDALIVSKGLPRSVHVLSFLTDVLNGAGTVLVPKIEELPLSIEKGEVVNLLLTTAWDFESDIGTVPWQLSEVRTGKVISRFSTIGTQGYPITLETKGLAYGSHRFRIEVDKHELALDLAHLKIEVSMPQITFGFTVEPPPVGLIVETNVAPAIDEDITTTLRSLFGRNLTYAVVDGNQPHQIRVVIQDNQGTPGSHGIEFCHMGLRIDILSDGAVVHSETVPKVKEAALGYDLAVRKAFATLEKQLGSDHVIFDRVNEALKDIIELENQ